MSKLNSNSQGTASNPVVAHRGAWKKNNLPENSIAALKEAIRLGCGGAEFDVRMSVDDTLLVNHDPTYEGWKIEKTSYQQLAQKKLFNGETLPTLRQYLLAGLENNRHTKLVVEIKPSPAGKERGEAIAVKVVELIRELKVEPIVIYISFDLDILKKIVETDPTALTQYLSGDRSPEQLAAVGINGADFNLSVYKNKPKWIEMAKTKNMVLNAWTVNDKANMNWLLNNKFDYITTNEPELLLSILQSITTADK